MASPFLIVWLAVSAQAATLPAALGQASLLLRGEGQGPAVEAVEGKKVLPNGVSSEVDLSGHFADGPRPQGDIGSCHAFTAVALLEDAMFRRTGKHVRYSEADLFMRRIVLRRTAYSDFLIEGDTKISEAFYTDKDLRFAIKNGVGSSLPYDDFSKRYIAYREAEARTLADLEKQRAAMTPEELKEYEPRVHWAKLQRSALTRSLVERRLTGGRDLTSERAASVEAFTGLKVLTKTFDFNYEGDGYDQGEYIQAQLDEGRVVGVSVSVSGMGHVYTVTGYTNYDDGSFFFHARDSDGAKTLEVDDLWMVARAYTLKEGPSK